MPEARSSKASLSSHNMVDRYEALRHRALNGRGVSAGLALFLDRGMTAWMHAWKEYSPKPRSNMQTKQRPSRAELPIGIQGDLVMALAGMALNVKRGQG